MSSDPWLQSYIQQYRPLCPLCRVPLHPQRKQCLRCRRNIQLDLKVLEAYLLAWGIAIAMLALEFGMGIILLYVALRDRSWWSTRDYIYLCIAIAGMLSGGVILLLLIFRRRFCNLPTWLQWIAAIFSGLVFITSLVVFAINLH